MKIINLFGAPGAGKSTGAAWLFAKLKMSGINAELVTEFAKDKVWEENKSVFKNQCYIFGKQCFKISRCSEKVDIIVTDSPLFLSAYYNKEYPECFTETVLYEFNKYENINFFINRVKEYNPIGRNQTEEESDQISLELKGFLQKYDIPYIETFGNEEGYESIANYILSIV